MTREEREALRRLLMAVGFERLDYTDDLDGTGRYTENWYREENHVALHWGVRS